MTLPVHDLPLTDVAEMLHTRDLSSRELVQAYLERIETHDDSLHCYITVDAETALHCADDVDRRRLTGADLPPLAGIPVAVKDSIPTAGIRTTANSRLLAGWVPVQDAVAIERLRVAGAIILGKTNLNEFGWALPADDDLTPPVRNPWNTHYAAIGSSSGSGAALAAGMCAAAIGTDGGGSARLPAGQHGLVGLKATHGRVSRLGMDSSSISEIAPLAHTVSDAALLLSAMAGPTVDDGVGWLPPRLGIAAHLDRAVSGWRVGVPRRDIAAAALEDEVAVAFASGLDKLERLGIELVDVDLPGLADARAANFVVLNAEAYATHAASLRAHPERYGESALVYHWMGAFLNAADYLHAQQVGSRVRELVQEWFRDVRLLVTPTSPVVTAEAARRPESHRRGANAAFTAPFNLTGHPALSLPAGISSSTGLPIGLQLVGPLFDELSILQLAFAYERAAPWSTLRPEMTSA
jgi:aspartyl-tRNA(Asn)/glutamyl-tRNA(Gln) amidotransferase subunit A